MKRVFILFLFFSREDNTDQTANDECETTHNLKDFKCVPHFNTRCESVGKICKKKCLKGQGYKCKGSNANQMQCDTEQGVCDAALALPHRRCSQSDPGPKSESIEPSREKCGDRELIKNS